MLTIDLHSNSVVPISLEDAPTVDTTLVLQPSNAEAIAMTASAGLPETMQPTSATISQTLVHWAEESLQPIVTPIPESLLGSMQPLVDVIQTLRSPDGGWSEDVPQTPSALLPYVTEEAYDLLDTLQRLSLAAPSPATNIPSCAAFPILQQHYRSVADLAPWMLWAIARSSYDVMQLMEGIAVCVAEPGCAEPDQTWQSGVLRLAIALQATTPDLEWTFDLVTHQLHPSYLSPTVHIDSPALKSENSDCLLTAETLLHQVTQQLQLATPALHPFVKGIATDILMPQHEWQSGCLKLQFGLEFIPTMPSQSDRAISSWAELDSPTETLLLALPTSSLTDDSLKPQIQFTDAAWTKAYSAIVNQDHLAAILTHQHMLGSLTCDNRLSATASLTDVVTAALLIADQLYQSSALASRDIAHQIWRMEELNLRLLWCVSRGAYEVMQLMGGISARVLKPNHTWQTGILRLSVHLKIQTPELDWQLDLVTGYCSHLNAPALGEDAVVQSRYTHWCDQPTLVKHLTNQVMQEIHQATPEIQLLLDGTDINLQSLSDLWQPGTMQLLTRFEFVADRSVT